MADGDDKDFGDWAQALREGRPWPPPDDGIRRRMVPAPGATMENLAKIAYEAYGKSTGGLNYQGLPMPPWEDLPEAIRHAWDHATQAVLRAVDTPPSDEDRIRDAMAEAEDHPGRVITR